LVNMAYISLPKHSWHVYFYIKCYCEIENRFLDSPIKFISSPCADFADVEGGVFCCVVFFFFLKGMTAVWPWKGARATASM